MIRPGRKKASLQRESIGAAGEYKGRGGHQEPKGMMGPGRKKASLQQESIRGGVVIRNLKR